MYLLEFVRENWLYLVIALPSLWVLTNSLLPGGRDGQRNDDATRKARAHRAKEYQKLHTYSDQYGNY